MKEKPSFLNIFFYFLLLILAIIAFLRFGEIKEVLNLFKQLKFELLVTALACQFLTYYFSANIYSELLKIFSRSHNIPKWLLLKISVVVLSINQALPSAGLSGNSFVVYFFSKKGVPPSKGFFMLLMKLLTFYGSYFILLTASIFYLALVRPELKAVLVPGLFGMLVYSFLILMAFILSSRPVLTMVLSKLNRFKFVKTYFKKYWAFEFAGQDGMDMPFLFKKYHRLLRALLYHIGIILLDSSTIYLLFLGFNIKTNFIFVILGLILAQVVGMFSITPGALVFFEGSMVFFYSMLSIPISAAFIVTLLFRAFSFWLPMPFGLFIYRHLSNND